MIKKTTGVCRGRSGKRIGTLIIISSPLMPWKMVRFSEMEEEMSRFGSKTSLMTLTSSRSRKN